MSLNIVICFSLQIPNEKEVNLGELLSSYKRFGVVQMVCKKSCGELTEHINYCKIMATNDIVVLNVEKNKKISCRMKIPKDSIDINNKSYNIHSILLQSRNERNKYKLRVWDRIGSFDIFEDKINRVTDCNEFVNGETEDLVVIFLIRSNTKEM